MSHALSGLRVRTLTKNSDDVKGYCRATNSINCDDVGGPANQLFRYL